MKIYTKAELQNKDRFTIQQAAIYADRSVDTIRRWIADGKIVAEKDEYGYRYLITKTSLDAYLEGL